jgi:hypothetical protein
MAWAEVRGPTVATHACRAWDSHSKFHTEAPSEVRLSGKGVLTPSVFGRFDLAVFEEEPIKSKLYGR